MFDETVRRPGDIQANRFHNYGPTSEGVYPTYKPLSASDPSSGTQLVTGHRCSFRQVDLHDAIPKAEAPSQCPDELTVCFSATLSEEIARPDGVAGVNPFLTYLVRESMRAV